MKIFKVYVTKEKKDGTILKSDSFIIKCNPEEIKDKAIKEAKFYGMNGNLIVKGIYIKDEQTKQFTKYEN